MATTLRSILFVLLFALLMQMQYNLDADKTATRQLKNAIELAVHDAALAVSPLEMAEGRIVFEQSKAIDNLKLSLEENLKIESAGGFVYSPKSNSFYKQDLYISHLEFVDDSITMSYPYTYVNQDYDILETLDGPSVIAVITTESPRWFNGGTSYIRQAAVYEYKK
ncbi:peptidase M23 [Neobacillus notoginsengisoli]|uniref:Peptidase M23 n=1 Tax=Neobacillus notoginsengisoli TaxID=1578198 RepID=A0A417YPR9_9BACI|nr:peptidase M23 [Neobacillus notoginsengisoli]RHW35958.1 peptidase M23 [Neobacillus notoginsengisoli]